MKIAIVVDAEQGHFFHTLQLAQELAKRRHQVAYWSFPEAMRLVRAQGFGFRPIVASDNADKPEGGRRLFAALVRGQLLDILVDESKPDVFLTLSIFSTGALALRYRYRIPVVLVRTNLTLLTRQEACQLVIEDLMSMSTEPLELIQLIKRSGIQVKSLGELSSLLLKIPEIAMISRRFERGEDGEEQGVYYVGGCVNVERSDVTFPMETISSDRRLIYCSSGSQAHLDCEANVRLFQLVIDSVKKRPDWQAIIAIGKRIDKSVLRCDAANVQVMTWVPQTDILKRASIMITHGGFNSVRECIALGVPMITFPMRRDQFDVSDRIVQHGVGRKGELLNMTEEMLTTMIEDVMTGSSYREQLKQMRCEFVGCDVDSMIGVIEAAARNRQ